MVRMIERQVVKNKDLFDRLYKLVGGRVMESDRMLHTFHQQLCGGLLNQQLLHQMHMYCDKYPYTRLINN